MTQQEHLAKVRAKCVELLEIASKRTQGKWETHNHPDGYPIGVGGSEFCGSESVCYLNASANSNFIATCAGPAEAGWKATIAAIDLVLLLELEEGDTAKTILAAWPEELI